MLGIRSPREGGGWKTESGLESHLLLSDIGLLSHATIDSYLDQSVKAAASPTFNQGNFTTLHTTTLLADHIGEHTGSHSIVFDNSITLGTLGSVGMALTGEADFAGTNSVSHINYSTTEATYIRGGKTGAAVNINDSHNGPVNIGAGGLVTISSNIVMAAQDIYRSGNDAALVINGGSGSGVGSHLILFGGTHASLASIGYFRAAQHRFESVAGTTAYFRHTGSHFYIDTGNCTLTAGHLSLPNGYSVHNAAWPGSATGTPIVTSSGFLYYLTSSERFKINIERNWKSPLLNDFLKINPIRYESKPQPEDDLDKDKKAPDAKDKVNPKAIGFSAEEIHASGVPGLINYDDDSLPFSLREHGFIVYHHLILQDLSSRITKLETSGGPK